MLAHEKLRRLQRFIREQDLDALLFLEGPVHNPFLQDMLGLVLEQAAFVVSRQSAVLLVSPLEQPYVQRQASRLPITVEGLTQSVGNMLHARRMRRIGFQYDLVTLRQFNMLRKEGLHMVDVSLRLNQLRAQKLPEGIRRIRHACRLTDTILDAFLSRFTKGMQTERALALLLRLMQDSGVEPAFAPIIAAGPHTAVPHALPKGKLKQGFLLIDLGVRYKGYCSDMTRTYALSKLSPQQEQAYAQLQQVQEQLITEVRDGLACKTLDDHARKELEPFTPYFVHALGHGVGTEVHEYPVLAQRSRSHLQEGYAFTIEPGVYIPRSFGIRIEDTLVLQRGKAMQLTRSEKGLQYI